MTLRVSCLVLTAPSGGGAFAFRTPSGVKADQSVLPHSPYKDIEEALFFVWRPYRWANWMFHESPSMKRQMVILRLGRRIPRGQRK